MVYFAFGIHNHQPVDNFGAVFEENYEKAYKPFLDTLAEFESVKVNFHVSGSLLEWLQEQHPEYVTQLRKLISQGRVEILTSGIYEPILTLLPEEDRLGQITMYTQTLKKALGATPRGLWLTERVWEQSLVRTLVQAGVEYVLVDDTHFRNLGYEEKDLFGYYIAEDQGRTLAVFPINKRLRYLVPFRAVSETVDLLAEQARFQGVRIATLFDDGEKFGSWPGTHEQVYKRGWLKQFCRELGNHAQVQFAFFSELLDKHPPLGRVYLDNGSYEEMGEWVMPPERFRQYEEIKKKLQGQPRQLAFLRTGFFRNFLVKYPEVNRLHKRMLFVSGKIQHSRKSEERKLPARTELYKAQANDVYWHGIFGGLYLPHLREVAYRHLLKADALLGENVGLQMLDIDACGRKEIVFDYLDQFIVINPAQGGTLVEFDLKPKGINWLNTLTRRPESYHARLKAPARMDPEAGPTASIHETTLTAPAGVEGFLHYDKKPRLSLLDHFYKLDTQVADCRQGSATELADVGLMPRDYQTQRYKIILSAGEFLEEKPCHLYKEITVEPKRLLVTYDVLANFWQPYRFAVDINTLPVKELRIGDRVIPPDAVGAERKVSEVRLVHWSGAELILRAPKQPFILWHYPVETVSSSEKGVERIYQGAALVLNWEQHKPGGVFEFEIAWS